jgi:epoxyqueuosine reductase QueG
MNRYLEKFFQESVASYPSLQWGACELKTVLENHPDALSSFPEAKGFVRAFVFALPLPTGALIDVRGAPTPLYLHHYRQLNYALDRLAYSAALAIEEDGYRAVAIPASQYTTVHPQPKGHLSHRILAYYAGLGFIGRSRLLVNMRFGPRVRLATVLTDTEIPVNQRLLAPVSEMTSRGCGDCRRCVESCPAGAIGETSADYKLEKCLAKLEEFRKIQFVGQHICGICIKVCPFNGIGNQKQ